MNCKYCLLKPAGVLKCSALQKFKDIIILQHEILILKVYQCKFSDNHNMILRQHTDKKPCFKTTTIFIFFIWLERCIAVLEWYEKLLA